MYEAEQLYKGIQFVPNVSYQPKKIGRQYNLNRFVSSHKTIRTQTHINKKNVKKIRLKTNAFKIMKIMNILWCSNIRAIRPILSTICQITPYAIFKSPLKNLEEIGKILNFGSYNYIADKKWHPLRCPNFKLNSRRKCGCNHENS